MTHALHGLTGSAPPWHSHYDLTQAPESNNTDITNKQCNTLRGACPHCTLTLCILLHSAAYCILHTAYCTLHTAAYCCILLHTAAYCILHTAYCCILLHTAAYCILHTAYCILHTAYCILLHHDDVHNPSEHIRYVCIAWEVEPEVCPLPQVSNPGCVMDPGCIVCGVVVAKVTPGIAGMPAGACTLRGRHAEVAAGTGWPQGTRVYPEAIRLGTVNNRKGWGWGCWLR